MRILLVQPAPFEERRLGLENTIWCSEPVALASVAAMAPEAEVRILDMRLERTEALPRALVEFRPDVVGTTAMTTDAYQALAVLRLARALVPEALTVVGGHHPTMMPDLYHTPFVDAIVKGEGEIAFRELLDRWAARPGDVAGLASVAGCEVRLADGRFSTAVKRAWVKDLDTLPAPARHLLAPYLGKYFFLAARPMASIFTSRGCSYDCNFCAIWEFYDRKTRFLSARVIADRMEACSEPFVFFLDDNFLSRTDRLTALCDELERRGIRKYWMSQGRADFVAQNPDLMARLARNGMMGILSGYESNAEDALEALNKRSTLESNRRAAAILKRNGIISTGLFMVRPDFERDDFEALFDYIIELGVAIPLVTILTPLPGTQLWRQREADLLTKDFRLFDLLHSVLPTRLPREEFYAEYVKWKRVGHQSRKSWFDLGTVWKRRGFYLRAAPNVPRMVWDRLRYERIQFDARTYLRDEEGIIRPERRQLAAK